LLSVDPATFLVNCIKPRSNNLLSYIEIPRADQEIVEALIPKETSAKVTSRWYTCKEHTLFSFVDISIFIEKLLVTIHISNATEKVT